MQGCWSKGEAAMHDCWFGREEVSHARSLELRPAIGAGPTSWAVCWKGNAGWMVGLLVGFACGSCCANFV